ncbi:hypothetical protein FRX31_018816 [Thalictrum thalictroides]|uniref:Secreted protein n=1 Tax=Thalictrum thalictroides TaxID=46969 RepID=A0A7J6W3D1_THATH|nr:hypothetical protein FRX31_018816 [Thalictrum thalictroides]
MRTVRIRTLEIHVLLLYFDANLLASCCLNQTIILCHSSSSPNHSLRSVSTVILALKFSSEWLDTRLLMPL